MYIADWLSQSNHREDTDQEILDMNIRMHAISTSVNIPICTSIEDVKAVIWHDANLQRPKSYIVQGWSYKKWWGGTEHEALSAN